MARTHHSAEAGLPAEAPQPAAKPDAELLAPPRLAQSRVVVEAIAPSVDGGRFAAKAVANETVVVEADVFCDGHDRCRAVLRSRRKGGRWIEQQMRALGNDRFAGEVALADPGEYEFEITGVVDHVATMRDALEVKERLAMDVSLERAELVDYLGQIAERSGATRQRVLALAARIEAPPVPAESELDADLLAFVARRDLHEPSLTSMRHRLLVERERAATSNWYELFPRSAGSGADHGTFQDVIARLDYIAGLGANVLYLPPIHPIGVTNRKGANNVAVASPADPGSPWAIGAECGGHCAIHPDLGDFADFHELVAAASQRGIEIALDFALQCSPDHPWVRQHPEWFRHRIDGSIAFAENPPKRYEDVYPLDFSNPDWRDLWEACAEVVEFWVEHGVRIFRVDNPHTKPLRLWEWLMQRVRLAHPDVIFLAEAFTRPKIMYQLAKAGFSQSYTYFAWRTERWEIEQYLRELTTAPVSSFFRPNFWPNTPDILTEQLQVGGRSEFALRAMLAATLSANWGIYGPLFELGIATAREQGSEEYANSDKYAVNHYDFGDASSLAPLIASLNHARSKHEALQRDEGLVFHPCDNEQLLVFSKRRRGNEAAAAVLVVVNLDPNYPQSGFVTLDRWALGVPDEAELLLHDELSGERYRWREATNFVLLDPARQPGHLFSLELAAALR